MTDEIQGNNTLGTNLQKLKSIIYYADEMKENFLIQVCFLCDIHYINVSWLGDFTLVLNIYISTDNFENIEIIIIILYK